MKLALAELGKSWTPELEGCYPVMVIHDELIVEAPEEKEEKAAQWVKKAMIEDMRGLLHHVPVEVEVSVCRSYEGQFA
jgi:DNA polymerase I